MKKFLTIFLLLISYEIGAQNSLIYTMDVNGTERTYRQYVPDIYDGSQAVPVVFNFHGYGSTAMEQEIYANFKPIADTANFILVFPQGLIDGNGNTFWHDFSTLDNLQIDLDFFDQMLDSLEANFNIDLNRIYSTGMSNGGFFSYDLACHRSNKIAAIASVSGTQIALHSNWCNATHPTPIMHFHGTADDVVFYQGNGGIVNALGAEDIVNEWFDFNQCNSNPEVIQVPNTNTLDGSTVEHYIYHDGNENSTVEFFKIIGGGHSWPGAFPLATLGTTNQDINACQEIWRFFSQYQLDDLVQVDELENESASMTVFPNPANNSIQLTLPTAGIFELFDFSGKKVLEQTISPSRTTIDIAYLDSGMYLYRLTAAQRQQVAGKLIVK